ncbi:MAG: hypothetical protein JRH01_15435 [Deltaproteobacteria bacterium]|nr:hypothetical protein [Deltaproteobacteria bacterium]
MTDYQTSKGNAKAGQTRDSKQDSEQWERARKSRSGARKERILHTRISEQLSEDIRAIADDLRVPVSNLVRNVLEEAFSAAERVTDDVGDLLDDVLGEAERASERVQRFRERHGPQEERFRETMERASDQVGRAAERFADTVDRLAQRARERSAAREEAVSRPSAPSQAESEGSSGEEPAAGRFEDIVAWQPVVLNSAQTCAVSGEAMQAGHDAYMGIGRAGFSGVYVKEVPVSHSS